MRVLVAGASGVIGTPLIPLLTGAGHHVTAMSRRPGRTKTQADAAVEVVVADALDRDSVTAAVRAAAPDAVVNLLTAIPRTINLRRLAKDSALTNRLRVEGTRNLMEAAGRANVRKVVAQSLAYGYQPGRGLANEDEPLWHYATPQQFVPVLAAVADLERQTLGEGGLVLRLGHLCGPGTAYAPDGAFTAQVRAGRVPVIGGGRAVFSFTHTHDAARAVLAALESDVSGVLNIVNDTPVPVHEWLPDFAWRLGLPAPRQVSSEFGRLAFGTWGVAFMDRLRGADNTRARSVLDWRPLHAMGPVDFPRARSDGSDAASGRAVDR